MAETISILTHLGLALIAAYILSQGKAPFWNTQGYIVYIIYGAAGVLTNVLDNNSEINRVYRIIHDVAYVFSPAFFAMGVAIGIYRLDETLACIFLIAPVLYVFDFFMSNVDAKLIEMLTQIVGVSIAMFSALKENYEGTVAGVLFLVASFMDHIKSSSSAKDISMVNGILIAASIALWYAFGGSF